ncbi:hypothetical protein J2Z83_003833 [Virgibacillus natechei]|uniref:3-methyladenine DNA glycosylase n=1 Tax=Virgibacillus natechei TaxID=1216297 RepID=A0ABS4ILC1_9BACI|nr:hypothetical protein [Virgibacillus natechei]
MAAKDKKNETAKNTEKGSQLQSEQMEKAQGNENEKESDD